MRWLRTLIALWVASVAIPLSMFAQTSTLQGQIIDPHDKPLPNALIHIFVNDRSSNGLQIGETASGEDGRFELKLSQVGRFDVEVRAQGFRPVTRTMIIRHGVNPGIAIQMSLSTQSENITVTADINETDVLSPDPGEKVFVRQDLLDANPGRPGAPVSIPGHPIETASGGIKAPQYFAPGVAGDHGEPIAQYVAVGSFLLPNNLSANAHGNGYADPNIFIPEILESVKIDGGAFDVREGNHSVNMAAAYGLRQSLDPFITAMGDDRDIDVVAGISTIRDGWMTLEAAYGNGFLDRLEHRQQYKFNGQRVFHLADHRLTLLEIGYYGRSYVPGLIPIFSSNAGDAIVSRIGDTIDPRQKDQTHTALIAANDIWQIRGRQQLQLSGFFRTYNLSLFSNFGQGLIRQSEFRTVAGGSANYMNKIVEYFSLLAGFDYEREAPRRDDLDRYGSFRPNDPGYYGPFTSVDANNVTLGSLTPYLAVEGAITRHFRYYLGWRRDEIDFDNEDMLRPQNSFQKWVGVNSPKATVSFLPKDSWYVPLISLSFGQGFFTEDPRIGTGSTIGTPVATSHSYQLVASKTVHKTDLRLTLGHITSSAELAKIDPDTGLQIDQGPSRLRFMAIEVRRNFNLGSLQASFSKADARDLDSGEPTPEAPRTIFDALGTIQKLPFRMQAKAEFELVGAKPLGTGCLPNLSAECTGTSVREFRGALVRPFLSGRLDAGINFLIASGYTGQTVENFGSSDIGEVVGVRIQSYASVSITYKLGTISAH